MGDMLQIVRWALETTCALRSAEWSTDPGRSVGEVAMAKAVGAPPNELEEHFGVFGDVYVSSCRYLSIPEESPAQVPEERSSLLRRVFRLGKRETDRRTHLDVAYGGFLISQQLGHVGGLDGLKAMCSDCPANALAPHTAGCAGALFHNPEDPQLQADLEDAIGRLGLHERHGECFIKTDPIWYGLWARSPLTDGASELLDQVLTRVTRRLAERDMSEPWRTANVSRMKAFVRATRLSRTHGLRLHVSMSPPGHADFGDATIHAHCPRCKAFAKGVPRWMPKYPSTPCRCHVCGMDFDAAETVSSSKSEDVDDSLRTLLGDEKYYEFLRSYLAARHFEPTVAARVIARMEEERKEGIVRAEEERRRSEKQDRFIARVLYAGLHPTKLDGADPADAQWFRADELREVIRRGKQCKAKFQVLRHHSVREALRMKEWAMTRGIEKLLRQWEAMGCNEWFSTIVSIPDEALAGWADDEPPAQG
jgi:hypothetical protein